MKKIKRLARPYFKINYSTLKEMIEDVSNEFTIADIQLLLELGVINQLQYEDLMTIVHAPEYDIIPFYDKDNGYYRQQGPLPSIETINDVTENLINRRLYNSKYEDTKPRCI